MANLCIDLNCTDCCSGVVHRRIAVREASHLLGDRGYVYLDRADKFEAAIETSRQPILGANDQKDRVKSFRAEGSGGDKRVNLYDPSECRHLANETIEGRLGGCGDYDNRAESCRRLAPGSEDCQTIRKERGRV
jgi:hypothetical protein